MSNVAENPEGFRIKTVSQITGLSPHLIRKWEQRYALLSPDRTPNGYRRYREEDLQLLLYIKAQIICGKSIGHLASQGIAVLREAMSDGRVENLGVPENLRQDCMTLIQSAQQGSMGSVEKKVHGFIQRLGIDSALKDVFFPILRAVGDLWHRGQISISGERGITQTIRRYLVEANRLLNRQTGSLAIIACFPNDYHEIGAMTAVRVLHQQGWRTTYLGPDSGIDLIHLACQRRQSKLVVLSCVVEPSEEDMKDLIDKISSKLLPLCPVLIGGKGASLFIDWLEQRGIRFIQDVQDLEHTKIDSLSIDHSFSPSTISHLKGVYTT